IRRSIERASGEGSGDILEEILYEGYGPGGVAVMVRALTDNRNRTAGEVRHLFSKYGGNLGQDGSVAFQFERKGSLVIERQPDLDEDQVFMDALEAGAEDVDLDDEHIIAITTAPDDYGLVRDALADKYSFVDQGLGYLPSSTISLSSQEDRDRMDTMIDKLEDNDDVQEIYHNWEEEA
ncbi:MAG TPA: YebC/PmpR family DNA-binding transcriptional regulator, partial [Clostridia bacterium]|nr:YebC/PmpR family DNA-binding transcriptional regulator [Clostridia bacterium]